MKASELKSALDPHVKRAAQKAVDKIKTDIKKQSEVKKMSPQKKEEVRYVKASTFDGLKEIVDMKKQKAVANELDSLIYEQERIKNKRSDNVSENKSEAKRPSLIEAYVASNPDKIKDMSMDEIKKLSMLMNTSSGNDPLTSILLMNMDKKGNNGGEGDLQTKLLGMVIEKLFKGNNDNENKSGGDMEMVKLMMQQNMQTQNLMMGMIMQKNEAPAENQNNTFMKEMFTMQRDKNEFENTFMKDKIRELELRSQNNDPLGEAKRMLDYVKTFGGGFGGQQNATPESMNHELKLKELNFEQQRQVNEESRRVANMEQIGSMINNTIETFGKVLGEPIAEAAKTKIEQFTEKAQNPPPVQKVRISPAEYQKEIDLGNLEDIEQDLAQYENPKPKSSRFKVYETG